MQRLLIVDWSHFLQLPLDNPEHLAALDWIMEPQAMNHLDWAFRRALLGGKGVPLVNCGGWQRFANRFQFCPGAKKHLYRHAPMAIKLVQEAWESGNPILEITCFSSSHHCGSEPPGTPLCDTQDGVQQALVDDTNFLAVAIKLYEVRVEVYLPSHHSSLTYPEPQVAPAVMEHDSGKQEHVPYDQLLLCQSGDLVPNWCDTDWLQFVTTWQGLSDSYLEDHSLLPLGT